MWLLLRLMFSWQFVVCAVICRLFLASCGSKEEVRGGSFIFYFFWFNYFPLERLERKISGW
jgi:hypothetical protein